MSSFSTSPTCASGFSGAVYPSSAWIPRNANWSATSAILAHAGICPRVRLTITTSAPIPPASPYPLWHLRSAGEPRLGRGWRLPRHAGFRRSCNFTLVAHRRGGPVSRQLLILSDTGGSNGCRCRAWKTELQSQLADPHGLALTVAHYPTGASKWNPIEHRLFSEISKNWAGEPLDSYQKILRFIHPFYQNPDRSVRYRVPRPPLLPYRRPTNFRGSRSAPAKAARGPAQVELYDLTKSVKLFLRQPLAVDGSGPPRGRTLHQDIRSRARTRIQPPRSIPTRRRCGTQRRWYRLAMLRPSAR
jgi:hypothetical protein